MQKSGGNISIVDMKCVTLENLLKAHDVDTVDYMSLDVEGKELDILKTIDFDKVNIRCISVENNYKDPQINEFLTTKSYQKVADLDVDEIYYKV